MEGFDSNPFGDSNPFSDSSVNQARKGINSEATNQLEDFNPFANDQFKPESHQPAVIQPTQTYPSSNTITATSLNNNNVARTSAATTPRDSLAKQQEELDRKAAELDRREQNLNQTIAGNANNFPPLPSFCPLKPCFIQDFNVDIPQQFQLIVRVHFYVWISFTLLMFINIFGALSYLIVNQSTESGTSFGLSILYFVLFVPLSYVCWFRPVYNAFKNDSSINYFSYFFVFFIHNCVLIVWCIGIPGSGGVGFISGIATSTGTNVGVGIFMIVVGVLFGVLGAIGMILIMRVLHFYRHTDASFQKAQAELASGVMSNRGVQQAAASAATSAFNDQSNYRY